MSHATTAVVTVGHATKAVTTVGHQATVTATVSSPPTLGHTTTAVVTVGNQTTVTANVGFIDTGGHSTSAVVSVGNATTAVVTVGHQTTVSIGVSAAITPAPASVTFVNSQSPTQTIALTQNDPGATFTAVSSSTSVATVLVNANSLFVTPAGEGTATITVTSSDGATVAIPVSVGQDSGLLTASVASLTLTNNGIAGAQTFTISRTLDTGAFTLQSIPAGLVTITGSGNAPGPVTYTVFSTQVGMGSILVTAADGTQITIPVTVYGVLNAFQASRRGANPLVINVGKQGYTGAFNVTLVAASGSTDVTIAPANGFGPSQAYTITDPTVGEYYLFEVSTPFDAPVQFTLQTLNPSLGIVPVPFMDETGVNPIPAGVEYALYYTGDPIISPSESTPQNPATVVGFDPDSTKSAPQIGVIGLGGVANLSVSQSTGYTVTFTGVQAPKVMATFTTGLTATQDPVVTKGYRSPNLSTQGYAVASLAAWTSGWIANEFKDPNFRDTFGNPSMAYTLASALAAALQRMDERQQTVSLATRLESCSGAQAVGYDASGNPLPSVDTVASFGSDFLGNTLPRQTNESDASYKARIQAALSGTLNNLVTDSTTLSGYFEAIGAKDSNGNPIPPGTPTVVKSGVGAYATILNAAQTAWNAMFPPANGNYQYLSVFDNIGNCIFDTKRQIYVTAFNAGTPFATYATALSLANTQFVILLPNLTTTGDAFFASQSYNDQNTYLIPLGSVQTVSSPSTTYPVLYSAVNSRRATSTTPIFAQIHN